MPGRGVSLVMVDLSHAGRRSVLRCVVIGGWLAIAPVPSAYQPLTGVQKAQTDQRLARPVCLLENTDTVTPRQESADLSEDAKRNLFLEIARVRSQAKTESEKAYPTGSSGLLAPSSGKSTRLDLKRNAMRASLEAQYLEPVIDRHHVSCDRIRQIFQEGQLKKWPSR